MPYRAGKSDLPGIQNLAGRCKPLLGKINNADTPDLHLSGCRQSLLVLGSRRELPRPAQA
jgi:hypothetical protein